MESWTHERARFDGRWAHLSLRLGRFFSSRLKLAAKTLPLLLPLLLTIAIVPLLGGCASAPHGDEDLKKNTYIELVDWHISGLWVINCPVAWVRVANYNTKPIKDIVFQYNTFDAEGQPLDQGVATLEGTVNAGDVHNFIEQYLGLVNLNSDKLSIKLLSVSGE